MKKQKRMMKKKKKKLYLAHCTPHNETPHTQSNTPHEAEEKCKM